MKVIKFRLIASAAMIGLGACVHIDDDGNYYDDELALNTERAVEVCGEGRVAEVHDDGFTCKP